MSPKTASNGVFVLTLDRDLVRMTGNVHLYILTKVRTHKGITLILNIIQAI